MTLFSVFFAATVLAKPLPIFNLDEANLVLTEAESSVNQEIVSLVDLRTLASQLSSQRDEAGACVKRQKTKLQEVQKKLQASGSLAGEGGNSADLSYLSERSKSIKDRLSLCRLFYLKSSEIIDDYREKIAEQAASQIGERDKPMWTLITSPGLLKFPFISSDKIFTENELKQFKGIDYAYLILLMTVVTAILLALRIYYLPKAYMNDFVLVMFSICIVSMVYLSVCLKMFPITNTILQMLLLGAVYFFFMLLLRFNSHAQWAKKAEKNFSFNIPFVYKLSTTVITIAALYYLFGLSVDWQLLSKVQKMLIELLAFLLTYVFIFVLFSKVVRKYKDNGILSFFSAVIKLGIVFVMLLSLGLDVFGYHQLAKYLSVSLISSIFYFFVSVVMFWLINAMYTFITDKRRTIAKKIRKTLGTEHGRKIIEFLTIKFLLRALTVYFLVVMLVISWDLSTLADEKLIKMYFDGLVIFNSKVVPKNILTALLMFCFLNIIVRIVATRMIKPSKRAHLGEPPEMGLSPIVMYVGISISFLIALLITGVNLTGLAIVAGALSVGIGLGLKDIVNNFLSGLILYVEKPIRVGDRIIVNGSEGIVQRIRVRSTQIRTLDRSDIIIPNEEIMVSQVTNYMLMEPYWRVKCAVRVAYGSDVKQVADVLLNVGNTHKEVINDDPNQKPVVLFLGFGESSLDFELRCIISHVNHKERIESELYFAIEKVLREQKIRVPFPQRQVHIQSDPRPSKK